MAAAGIDNEALNRGLQTDQEQRTGSLSRADIDGMTSYLEEGEDHEVSGRQCCRCVLDIKDLRRDIYALILGGCGHEFQSDGVAVRRKGLDSGARGRKAAAAASIGAAERRRKWAFAETIVALPSRGWATTLSLSAARRAGADLCSREKLGVSCYCTYARTHTTPYTTHGRVTYTNSGPRALCS